MPPRKLHFRKTKNVKSCAVLEAKEPNRQYTDLNVDLTIVITSVLRKLSQIKPRSKWADQCAAGAKKAKGKLLGGDGELCSALKCFVRPDLERCV